MHWWNACWIWKRGSSRTELHVIRGSNVSRHQTVFRLVLTNSPAPAPLHRLDSHFCVWFHRPLVWYIWESRLLFETNKIAAGNAMEIIITEVSFTSGREIKPSSSKNNTYQGHNGSARHRQPCDQSGTVASTNDESVVDSTFGVSAFDL